MTIQRLDLGFIHGKPGGTCFQGQELYGTPWGDFAATCTYITNAVDPATATTYNGAPFQGLSFGAEAANRYILVAGAARGASGNTTVSSATIGGVAATILVNLEGNNSNAFFLIAALPNGTSGDVSVTFGGDKVRCGIGIYRVINLQSTTPVATAQTSMHPHDLSVNVNADGFVVAIDYTAQGSPTTITGASWSGLSEDFEVLAAAWEPNGIFTGAHENFAEAHTPRAITCTWTGSVSTTAAAAVSMR